MTGTYIHYSHYTAGSKLASLRLVEGHSERSQRVLVLRQHRGRGGRCRGLQLAPLAAAGLRRAVFRGLQRQGSQLVAALAALEVRTLVAVPAQVSNGLLAVVAGRPGAHVEWPVQVVEDHQGRVLRSPQGIELIMSELARFQEGVSGVH